MTGQKEDRPQKPGAANNSQLHDSNVFSITTPADTAPEAEILQTRCAAGPGLGGTK